MSLEWARAALRSWVLAVSGASLFCARIWLIRPMTCCSLVVL